SSGPRSPTLTRVRSTPSGSIRLIEAEAAASTRTTSSAARSTISRRVPDLARVRAIWARLRRRTSSPSASPPWAWSAFTLSSSSNPGRYLNARAEWGITPRGRCGEPDEEVAMIRRQQRGDQVRITFALPDLAYRVSVVGDFNDWTPGVHTLV